MLFIGNLKAIHAAMVTEPLCSEFAAKYLPAIIAAYREETTPENMPECILNLISDQYVNTNVALIPTHFSADLTLFATSKAHQRLIW